MRCINKQCENYGIISDDCAAAPKCEYFEPDVVFNPEVCHSFDPPPRVAGFQSPPSSVKAFCRNES